MEFTSVIFSLIHWRYDYYCILAVHLYYFDSQVHMSVERDSSLHGINVRNS